MKPVPSSYEGAQRLRRRKALFIPYVLIGMVVTLALLITFRHIVTAGLAIVILNPTPQVIPALREWQGSTGSFMITSTSRIAVDSLYAAQLENTSRVFENDLFEVTGHPLPIVPTNSPAAGDFYLTLKITDPLIGSEGYHFDVGDVLAIRANTSSGVFYGTRTALQLLFQDPGRLHIARGIAVDYPKYRERGFALDVGRKFFSIGALEDYVKMMAWYKMNDFHLHLNDNEIGAGDSPDWMHKYAAFRLNSDRFKGLAARDGSYTRQDMRELQDVARQYAVTITPEIDTPAHALAFTQYRPDLASQKYSKEFLDL